MRKISVLLIFAVGVTMCGCGKKKPAAAIPVPKVTAAKPIQKEVTRHAYFTGRLDSFARVDITARVEGFLQKINFNDGDMVKKGQLLFEIEQDQYSAIVEQAKGQLKSVIAQHNDAEVNYKRVQYAFKQNVATSQELSDAQAKFEVTAADVETKDGMLKQAQINLGYTRVYSPIDGMAGKHQIDVGNLVGYGQPTLLVTVIQQDPLYVYFEVSEQSLIMYRKFIRSPENNKNVEIDRVDLDVRLAGETGYIHKGKLDLSYEGNDVNPNTGTITWRGILENKDRLMTPGMFARVRLPLIKVKNTLLVPQVAVGKDLTGNYVFVVGKGNTVEQRHVELLGENYENMVAIVEGLSADELVVTNGIQNVRNGGKCQPEITELKMVAPPQGLFNPGSTDTSTKPAPQSKPAAPNAKPATTDSRKKG